MPKLICFCNLFILKKGRGRYRYKNKQKLKTYHMHIQFYTDKRHLIYKKKKTFCNTALKFQTLRTVSMATTFYTYILFV